jgi:peptidoglycan/LPS O-acetylase OafA/YrhL
MTTPTEIPSPSKQRLPGLDVLRGVAVLLVLGHHLPPMAKSAQGPDWFTFVLETWRRGGWVGVDLFFVLSGFLVSGLLFAEYRARNAIGLSRFYVRRGWKIYPPFVVFIAVTVLVNLAVHRTVDMRGLASECLFLQSYVPGLWNHTWSLAVEEHFYIALPMLLLCILAFRKGSPDPFATILPIGIGVIALLVLAARIENALRMPWYHHHTHLAPTHLRIDSLLFGVLIAYGYHFHRQRFDRLLRPWRNWLLILGCTLLAAPFAFAREEHAFVYVIGPTVYYLGAGALMVGMLFVPVSGRGGLAALAACGAYSYSIYLWHMPVMRWGAPKINAMMNETLSTPVLLLLHLGGSIAAGVVMARAVEVPALRLRDRWFPSVATGRILPPVSGPPPQSGPAFSSGIQKAGLSGP